MKKIAFKKINLVDKIKIINRTQSTIFSNMPDHLASLTQMIKINKLI